MRKKVQIVFGKIVAILDIDLKSVREDQPGILHAKVMSINADHDHEDSHDQLYKNNLKVNLKFDPEDNCATPINWKGLDASHGGDFDFDEDMLETLYADDLFISSSEGFVWHIPSVEGVGQIIAKPPDLAKLLEEKWIIPAEFKYRGGDALRFIAHYEEQLAKYVLICLDFEAKSFDDLMRESPHLFDIPAIKTRLTEAFLDDKVITRSAFGRASVAKRWGPTQQGVDHLVEAAKSRWDSGCPFDHAKMTHHLFSMWEKRFPKTSTNRNTVLAKIKKVAPPDKIAGLPGVSKNQEPASKVCKSCKVKNPTCHDPF